MVAFTPEVIKQIHSELEKFFPKMEKGIFPEKEYLLLSAIEKPNRTLYGSESPYQDFISKAAVMMEALTRWHIFIDGNKRTGLLTAFLYLYVNKIYFAIPIDSVKFTIKVADTKETDPDSTEALIQEIANWLRSNSTTKELEFFGLVWMHNTWPALKLNILYRLGFKKKVKRILNDWYALETHPDYVEEEAKETSAFLQKLMKDATNALLESLDTKRKQKKK
jgi:death-on-curing protein